VQAVLIAGGLGTRLRPLTLTRPKALVPLLNRPMVLHLIERLPEVVDEVIVAANYLTPQLEDFFRREDVGRPVTVVREKRPLGTGGCLKNLEDRLSGTFLAFNGDVISSLAVVDFLAAHRQNGGIGTISLWEVEDPTAFGVVALEGTRVKKFVEKPPADEAPSRLANAGAYAFEPEILDVIPAKEPVSLERDVFPKVLRKGLHGFQFTGYWADAGTLETFLRATEILLRAQGSEVNKLARVLPSAKVVKPVAIGADALVEGEIGPVVTVGRGCAIADARVSHSVLLDGVTVDAGASVSGSILGERCRIGSQASVRNSILGDGVSVKPGAEVVDARVKR